MAFRRKSVLGGNIPSTSLTMIALCHESPLGAALFRFARRKAFLGSFSKDSIVAMTTGWSEDMRVPTFVQNFLVAFYMVNAWTAADFTLVKAKTNGKK